MHQGKETKRLYTGGMSIENSLTKLYKTALKDRATILRRLVASYHISNCEESIPSSVTEL